MRYDGACFRLPCSHNVIAGLLGRSLLCYSWFLCGCDRDGIGESHDVGEEEASAFHSFSSLGFNDCGCASTDVKSGLGMAALALLAARTIAGAASLSAKLCNGRLYLTCKSNSYPIKPTHITTSTSHPPYYLTQPTSTNTHTLHSYTHVLCGNNDHMDVDVPNLAIQRYAV